MEVKLSRAEAEDILLNYMKSMFPNKVITGTLKSYGEGAEFEINEALTPVKEGEIS